MFKFADLASDANDGKIRGKTPSTIVALPNPKKATVGTTHMTGFYILS
jgi:hypothetical protein